MKLVIESRAREVIESRSLTLPQSLLLTGKKGVGLRTIALEMASSHTIRDIIEPVLLTSKSTTPQIGIDTVRKLYEHARSKSTDAQVIIIDDVDMMTHSAQNSFLKLLEEPGNSIHFILTSHHPERLLSTVRSRLQTIHIPIASQEQTTKYISTFPAIKEVTLRQILFLASGLPAEINRLLTNEAYFTRNVEAMSLAKKLVEATLYERMSTVISMKSERTKTLDVIEKSVDLLSRSPSEASLSRINALLLAHERIKLYGNPRLQLAGAMI